jgi:hypothetical protein
LQWSSFSSLSGCSNLTITGVAEFDSLRGVRVIPYGNFIPWIISLFIRFGAQVRKLGLLLGCQFILDSDQ